MFIIKKLKIKRLFLFLVFTIFYFVCLSAKKVLAVGLEVPNYPTILGSSLQGGTGLPEYMLYLFKAGVFIGIFATFLSLVVGGAMYVLSPINASFRSEARDKISGAIAGFLIIVLSYLIITTINPQLGIFQFNGVKKTPLPPAQSTQPAGVYFYKNAGDCPNGPTQLTATSDVEDLGPLKNLVKSVGITKDTDNNISYVSILYDNPGLWGKCLYLNPNSNCHSDNVSFASSASVHAFNFSPNGDGVYFFRKPCFNKINQQYSSVKDLINDCKAQSDGYYEVNNSSTSGIYWKRLQDLSFSGVPDNQQDCVKYDKDGNCATDGRQAPNLSGENISSMIINGSYIVVFVYLGPNDPDAGPWTFCQEFPASPDADVNGIGPQQIKWENIRNSSSVVPNYVAIIPVANSSPSSQAGSINSILITPGTGGGGGQGDNPNPDIIEKNPDSVK